MLTPIQVEEVIKWMNIWEQLKDTAIPIRFKEDFTKALLYQSGYGPCKNVTDYRKQLWIAAVSNVAGAFNCESSDIAITWADNILKAFDKRFSHENV